MKQFDAIEVDCTGRFFTYELRKADLLIISRIEHIGNTAENSKRCIVSNNRTIDFLKKVNFEFIGEFVADDMCNDGVCYILTFQTGNTQVIYPDPDWNTFIQLILAGEDSRILIVANFLQARLYNIVLETSPTQADYYTYDHQFFEELL